MSAIRWSKTLLASVIAMTLLVDPSWAAADRATLSKPINTSLSEASHFSLQALSSRPPSFLSTPRKVALGVLAVSALGLWAWQSGALSFSLDKRMIVQLSIWASALLSAVAIPFLGGARQLPYEIVSDGGISTLKIPDGWDIGSISHKIRTDTETDPNVPFVELRDNVFHVRTSHEKVPLALPVSPEFMGQLYEMLSKSKRLRTRDQHLALAGDVDDVVKRASVYVLAGLLGQPVYYFPDSNASLGQIRAAAKRGDWVIVGRSGHSLPVIQLTEDAAPGFHAWHLSNTEGLTEISIDRPFATEIVNAMADPAAKARLLSLVDAEARVSSPTPSPDDVYGLKHALQRSLRPQVGALDVGAMQPLLDMLATRSTDLGRKWASVDFDDIESLSGMVVRLEALMKENPDLAHLDLHEIMLRLLDDLGQEPLQTALHFPNSILSEIPQSRQYREALLEAASSLHDIRLRAVAKHFAGVRQMSAAFGVSLGNLLCKLRIFNDGDAFISNEAVEVLVLMIQQDRAQFRTQEDLINFLFQWARVDAGVRVISERPNSEFNLLIEVSNLFDNLPEVEPALQQTLSGIVTSMGMDGSVFEVLRESLLALLQRWRVQTVEHGLARLAASVGVEVHMADPKIAPLLTLAVPGTNVVSARLSGPGADVLELRVRYPSERPTRHFLDIGGDVPLITLNRLPPASNKKYSGVSFSPDGKEGVYLGSDGTLYAVPVKKEAANLTLGGGWSGWFGTKQLVTQRRLQTEVGNKYVFYDLPPQHVPGTRDLLALIRTENGEPAVALVKIQRDATSGRVVDIPIIGAISAPAGMKIVAGPLVSGSDMQFLLQDKNRFALLRTSRSGQSRSLIFINPESLQNVSMTPCLRFDKNPGRLIIGTILNENKVQLVYVDDTVQQPGTALAPRLSDRERLASLAPLLERPIWLLTGGVQLAELLKEVVTALNTPLSMPSVDASVIGRIVPVPHQEIVTILGVNDRGELLFRDRRNSNSVLFSQWNGGEWGQPRALGSLSFKADKADYEILCWNVDRRSLVVLTTDPAGKKQIHSVNALSGEGMWSNKSSENPWLTNLLARGLHQMVSLSADGRSFFVANIHGGKLWSVRRDATGEKDMQMMYASKEDSPLGKVIGNQWDRVSVPQFVADKTGAWITAARTVHGVTETAVFWLAFDSIKNEWLGAREILNDKEWNGRRIAFEAPVLSGQGYGFFFALQPNNARDHGRIPMEFQLSERPTLGDNAREISVLFYDLFEWPKLESLSLAHLARLLDAVLRLMRNDLRNQHATMSAA